MIDGIAQLKLLEALRAPTVQPFEEVRSVYNLENAENLLELAVGANPAVFKSVLDYYAKTRRSINEQNKQNGNTPLHVVVLNNRLENAQLLLAQPTINDTIANNQGELAVDLSRTTEMQNLLNNAQTSFLKDVSTKLKLAFQKRDLVTLKELFASPRVQELVSLNGLDPETGSSVLHDAAAAGDSDLVAFILAQNADPLIRNSHQQAPIDVAKDPQVQHLLATAAKEQTVTGGNTEKLEGFLKKWTNFTQGYRSRWFVLESGNLKYYKNPKDKQPRDSISLSNATIKVQSSVNKGFELSVPGRKLVLRAQHANEANRWVWAIQNAISASQKPKKSTSSQATQATQATQTTQATNIASTTTANTVSGHARQPSQARSARFIDDLNDGAVGSDDEFDEEEPIEEPPHPGSMLAALDGLAALSQQPKSDQLDQTALATIAQLKGDIEMWKTYHMKMLRRLQQQLDSADNQQRLWAQNCRALEVKLEKAEGQLFAQSKNNAVEEEDTDVYYDTVDEFRASGTHEQQPAQAPEPVGEAQSDSHGAHGAAAGAGAGAGVAAAGGAAAASGEHHSEHHSEQRSEQQSSAPAQSKPAQAESSESTKAQLAVAQSIKEQNSFAGYEAGLRKKLPLDVDDRPKISLWGVLKSLVGKDMTKMALPVSFNECTNLLQRSAEDMEYVNLLDKAAATTDDAGLRMAYVAAFTASSYSSTIGRVAKPFNPLLGETFEYCRPDGNFRMMSEQVSHHPPVGALMAESPHWDFYGHSNVKSKFYGRSFDIVPTGLWYIKLRPNAGSDTDEELYTFRKVTSSVVGIMTGNPIVDNYGAMHITNHTNGLSCEFDFKARGWRGSSAYKVEGAIKDKSGKELWTVSGAWNDKIYAKQSGSNKKLLLWQVHERPTGPFNLTPFAITLNDLPKGLDEWLPPTDTRFRPDQRDMEEGQYDKASEDKNRVEEKQRAVRRQREASGEVYSPKWYKLEKHPVSGEEYYAPVNDYWGKRAAKDLKEGDIF